LWSIKGDRFRALSLLSSSGKSGMCMLIRGNPRPLLCACLSLTLVPFLSTSVLLNAQDAEEEAQRHFSAAKQAQESGDLELAAQEYLKVTHLVPNVAEAYASLGLVYNAQGKFAESTQALSKAEKLKPGLAGVSLYLGIDYEKRRQAGLAVPHLVEAVRVEPTNKQAYTWLGRALWDDGRIQPALNQLRNTAQLFPSDPALLLDLGVAYRKAADLGIERVLSGASGTPLVHQVYGDIYKDEHAWENAAAHYYRALDQDPHWHGAHFGLAEIALRREKLDAAAQEYQRELEVNSASAAAMARLAEIAMLQGKADEALSLLSKATHSGSYQAASALGLPHPYPVGTEDLSESAKEQLRACLPALSAGPPNSGRSLALAFAHARLGEGDASGAAWKDFTGAAPRSSGANGYERGLNNFYRQDFVAAAADLDTWLKLHPNDFPADYVLARTYRNLSLSTLEQLLSTAPDSYPAHELLAETYQNAEQDEKALAEYRIVAGMVPDLPGVHFSIGHLLLKMNQQDQAREELAAELRLNPDHAEANAEMGTLLLDRLDAANAIPYLQKAVQLDPDQWGTYQQLGRAYYMQKDYAQAEIALKQAVRHDPKGLAHYQLGLVYRSLGQKEAANEQFEISRKLKLEALAHDENQMNTLQSVPQ
jgi:tetratricopeptide (TPR) repeat protein